MEIFQKSTQEDVSINFEHKRTLQYNQIKSSK